MSAEDINKLFNVDLCIICQKVDKKKLSSSDNGRIQVRRAANLRRDAVYHRISVLPENGIFHYHLNNNCYKSYTHKNKLSKFNTCDDTTNIDESSNNISPSVADNVRSKRSVISTDKCIICNKMTNKKKDCLYEIGKERAELLFAATRFFQDDVFTKTINLNTAEGLVAAKTKYHGSCLRTYERKYERSQNTNENTSNTSNSSNLNMSMKITDAVLDVIKSLEFKLHLGAEYYIADISNLLKEKNGVEFSVKYSKIKSCLIDYFGGDICFVYSKERNVSQRFYLTKSKQLTDSSDHNCIITCAKIIKESLECINYNLEDKFCDETDLRLAWNNADIPKPFLLFLCTLFNCKEDDILNDNIGFRDTDSTIFKGIKQVRIKSLIQIMCYIKSKNIITVLNRVGLSISYDEILRIRTRLAMYITENSSTNVPIPSHFDENRYITGAFDNFDHNEATISGLNSTHDTVLVIFQDDLNNSKTKPSLSETSVNKRCRSFSNILKCQEVQFFHKVSNTVNLPSDYTSNLENKSMSIEALCNHISTDDFLWFLSRMNVLSSDKKSVEIFKTDQHVPSWSSFNSLITEDNRSKQQVGYLPIIPAPVTDFATVYTALCNFKNVLSQLNQNQLAVFCDEGVYRIARHILFERKEEFKNIVLCLGNFHITKVLQACIGKYIKNSGIENIFIEAGLFGLNAADQLFNGTNYSRCVKGFTYLLEALKRLQIKEFVNTNSIENYEEQLVTSILLNESFQVENFVECKYLVNQFQNSCQNLILHFVNFINNRCEESNLFKYYNNLIIMISLMLDLIRADRTGNWNLHLQTIEKIQPIFHSMDRVNYARWCSIYLHDMLMLNKNAPEVYEQFLTGRFTVKRSSVPFTSVATDQALEQTINRDSKSTAGIIGHTKKKETVAIWDLTYHELLADANFFKEVTYFDNQDEELYIHHDFSKTSTKHTEHAVSSILQYMESRKINPFTGGSQPLRNITTEELVQPEIADKILNIFNKGIQLYESFKEERLFQKTKPLSALISKNNLPDFKSMPNSEKSKSIKKKISTSETQKIIALAKERNYPLQELLKYDLTDKNQLFDDDGFFKKENNKSSLVRDLEKALTNNTDEFVKTDTNTCLVVDVMLVMRRIPWKGSKYFNDLARNFCIFVSKKVSLQKTKRVDFAFDSYNDRSIKSSEHIRRCKVECVLFNDITENTALPKQEEKFWGSSHNKILLQKFLREYIKNSTDYFSQMELVFSTINNSPCTTVNADSQNLLYDNIEEADLKIIMHVNNATKKEYTNIYVISSDTDVVVLLLYFFKTFMENGLQTLWIHAGVSGSAREIPVHSLVAHHGESLCSVLPALHHLTGADYTSKIGTKVSALHGNPEKYLRNFGKDYTEESIEINIAMAEQFLVNIVKKGTQCSTFDELRLWSYYHAKSVLIEDLPPTSKTIRLHILRSFYIVHMQINCLNDYSKHLDPNLFGWKEDNELLLPQRITILIPPSSELTYNCTCKVCSTKTCSCVLAEIPCCSFCFCKRKQTCKNKFNT